MDLKIELLAILSALGVNEAAISEFGVDSPWHFLYTTITV